MASERLEAVVTTVYDDSEFEVRYYATVHDRHTGKDICPPTEYYNTRLGAEHAGGIAASGRGYTVVLHIEH